VDAVHNLSRVPFIIDRLCTGKLGDLQTVMADRLHQQYRKPLIKHYDQIVRQGLKAGARSVVISGAGPTMIAFCLDNPGKVATAMSEVLTKKKIRNTTIILSPDTQGTRVTSMK
jgi:homoserine kinase